MLFPPKPGDANAWGAVLGSDWTCAPSVARRDTKDAAFRIASLFDAKQARAIQSATAGLAGDAFLRSMEELTAHVVGAAQAVAGFRGVAHGLAQRPRAVRLLGNGVCPLEAGYAWRSLSAAHGLGWVDLARTGAEKGSSASNGDVLT